MNINHFVPGVGPILEAYDIATSDESFEIKCYRSALLGAAHGAHVIIAAHHSVKLTAATLSGSATGARTWTTLSRTIPVLMSGPGLLVAGATAALLTTIIREPTRTERSTSSYGRNLTLTGNPLF